MAQFNNEVITEDERLREKAMKECGMYLQSCLSAGELEDLKEDWKEAGGFKVIPWWKFAFNNITVSYKSNPE
jgi:hypothetical protein